MALFEWEPVSNALDLGYPLMKRGAAECSLNDDDALLPLDRDAFVPTCDAFVSFADAGDAPDSLLVQVPLSAFPDSLRNAHLCDFVQHDLESPLPDYHNWLDSGYLDRSSTTETVARTESSMSIVEAAPAVAEEEEEEEEENDSVVPMPTPAPHTDASSADVEDDVEAEVEAGAAAAPEPTRPPRRSRPTAAVRRLAPRSSVRRGAAPASAKKAIAAEKKSLGELSLEEFRALLQRVPLNEQFVLKHRRRQEKNSNSQRNSRLRRQELERLDQLRAARAARPSKKAKAAAK